MKKNLLAILLGLFMASCQSGNTPGKESDTGRIHTVSVKEVIQTSEYTFLLVEENQGESWLALPRTQAVEGEKYYYKGGMPMQNFHSNELNKTFDNILFVDTFSTSLELIEKGGLTDSFNMNGSMPMADLQGSEQTMAKHELKAAEVLQTSQYTYIRGKEGDKEVWIAVAKTEARPGETYFFEGGLAMTDFPSKELKRTFKEILFVDNLYSTSAGSAQSEIEAMQAIPESKGSAIDLEKKAVNIQHGNKDITIASLYKDKKKYAGQRVIIRGEVTKFNPGIMKRNWIHIQDGTDFGGKFDLTLTSDETVNVGDKITVEGLISLDKDFGFGYFYDVIMEETKMIK